MRWLLLLLLAISMLARAGTASAGSASRANPSLDEARKAVDDIRYDDARGLLVQALKQGGSRPEQLVEIYRLSAATAAVLGSADLAEQYYRRMLALDPTAALPPVCRVEFLPQKPATFVVRMDRMGTVLLPRYFGLTLVSTAGLHPLCLPSYFHQTRCLEGRLPKW